MAYSSAAPKNILQQKLHETSREGTLPKDEEDRIAYGIISEINYNNGQVRVRRILSDGKIGDEVSNGFLPLSTPLSEIHLLWGALREGLVVRIYYKGKLNPKNVIVEVIGDEDHQFLNKAPLQNEVEIGAWKLFLGGVSF